MWFVVDLIILAIIALFTFIGYKKGLIEVIFKIVSFFIAIIVAFILSGPISNWIIENTDISKNMENTIVEKFTEEKVEEKEIEKEDINNTSQIVVDYINKQTKELKETGVKTLAKQITETAIRIIVAIGLYIITRVILFFFRKLAESLSDLPFVKQFNELGGTIYGLIKGLLIVYIALAILSLVAPMVHNDSLFELINSSIIGNFMYNHNIILNILL